MVEKNSSVCVCMRAHTYMSTTFPTSINLLLDIQVSYAYMESFVQTPRCGVAGCCTALLSPLNPHTDSQHPLHPTSSPFVVVCFPNA